MPYLGLAWWIEGQFLPAVMMLRDFISRNLLPAFGGVEEEVERVRSEARERLSVSADPDRDDWGDLSERAYDAGITYHEEAMGARQGVLNLFAVAIYHQFEQHQVTLMRRELTAALGDNDVPNVSEFAALVLKKSAIDVTGFSEWPKLDELRLVANVVKHAEGRASSELENIRPDMFRHPLIRNEPLFFRSKTRRQVFGPLSGQDLYVTEVDLDGYFEAIIGFWQRLSITPKRS